MVVNLIDSNFAGRDLSIHPRFFKWCTENKKVSNHIFFTDYQLQKVDKLKTDQKKIAWLLEPRAILPEIYPYIENNYKKFDYVLTFDRDLLLKINNGLFCPYGTYWVTDKEFYNKNKLLSIIASYKSNTVGQKLRHEVVAHIRNLDVFGRHPHYKQIESKNTALDNYYYSIVIENSIQNSYWTEKLLDCFITKTIPLYWGTHDVTNFFDKDGIIFFNTIEELAKKQTLLTPEFYKSKLSHIEKNYALAKQYKDPEDFIFFNYKYLLT